MNDCRLQNWAVIDWANESLVLVGVVSDWEHRLVSRLGPFATNERVDILALFG